MRKPGAARTGSHLAGAKILIVEDEAIVALLVEDMLREMGCSHLWHAASVAEALTLLQEHRPNAAILDVNLAGQPAYPIAVRLDAAGIPFIFASGYGRKSIPEQWLARPVVQKPFAIETLLAALDSALGR